MLQKKCCVRLWEESSGELQIGNGIVWRINRFGDRRVEGGAALGCVRLHANAKTSGAANLSNLTLYSTVHNPVRHLRLGSNDDMLSCPVISVCVMCCLVTPFSSCTP